MNVNNDMPAIKKQDKQKINKTVIITDYRCNNNCIFCIYRERREELVPRTTREIIELMDIARKRGSNYLEFIGGEFSIRPDCIELVKYGKRIGFDTISLTTNGRMYSYPKFAKAMVKAGLTSIVFSIHGPNAKIHDKLTQSPGSFKQLMAGWENFRKLSFKNIGTNTTIVKQNYKLLPEIGKLLFGNDIRNAEFIYVDPNYGGARMDFFNIMPTITDVMPYIKKCLDIGKINKISHWHIRYMPLCYLSDYLDQISELQEKKIFHTEHFGPDFQNFDVERSREMVGREKSKVCKKCKLNNVCEGIWKEYAKHHGLKELKIVS